MMQRMTRAKAAELAGGVVIPADATGESEIVDNRDAVHSVTPVPPASHREPLSEIAPNSAESSGTAEDDVKAPRKSTRGKFNRKKVVAKNQNKSSANKDLDEAPAVLPDRSDSPPSPASELAAEELLKDAIAAAPPASINETEGQTQQPDAAAAVRLTRRQLAKQTPANTTPAPKNPSKVVAESAAVEMVNTVNRLDDGVSASTLDAPASPRPSAVPNVIKSLRNDTPAKRSTSNKENVAPVASPRIEDSGSPYLAASSYDALEQAAVQSATPTRPQQRLSGRPEDHIDALDKLDDALEMVRGSIPDFPASPEKQRKKSSSIERSGGPSVKTVKTKPAPIVKTTKASQARLSMAQGRQRLPSLGPPRASVSLVRSASARVPSSSRAAGAAVQSASVSVNKNDKSSPATGVKKEVTIPHSRPRPVSISFPTPRPPRRSTKAPTQCTFRLPGEAVAEKLKAQREARMAQEATSTTNFKRTFKARPVPPSLKAGPVVRQTNTSKARTSMMVPADSNRSVSGSSLDRKRISSAASTSSGGMKPRQASADGALAMRPRQPPATTANVSKPRAPIGGSNTTTTSVSSASSTTGMSKGKEVLDRMTKSHGNAEKERREQAEATAKARIAAAERGRQASREWAEKQRLKSVAATKKN